MIVQVLPTVPLGQESPPLLMGLPAAARVKLKLPAIADGSKTVLVPIADRGSLTLSYAKKKKPLFRSIAGPPSPKWGTGTGPPTFPPY